MNPLLKKMMCIEWVRRAYAGYLERRVASLEGEYLLSEAKALRQGFEQVEERVAKPEEMRGLYTYFAFYAHEVFNRINRLPDQKAVIGRELADINIGYDEVKEEIPELTAWQFQHFKLKMRVPDFEGKTVPETVNQAHLIFQVALMGVLMEAFRSLKGRLPGIWEKAQFTPENGPVITYWDTGLKRRQLYYMVRD